VFVVGGSAAFGYPYAYDVSFAARLDRGLRPEGYRVLNAAQVGASSGTVREIAERILDVFDVHTLIVFAGNNEWIRWQPPSVAGDGMTTFRLYRGLARSRAVAFLLAWSLERSRAEARHEAERARTDGADSFVEHYELTGSRYALRFADEENAIDEAEWLRVQRETLQVFDANLTAIVRRATAEQTRVLLLSVPFNYRLSPAWKHPQPLVFDRESEPLARAAVDALEKGNGPTSLARIEAALAVEPRSALLHHLRGAQLESLARNQEAEAAYAQAREHMIGNLGSRLSINATIERVATETGAPYVDLRGIFDDYQHERQGYFNQDLIHDDCHPTPLGHRLIARTLRSYF